MHPQKIGGIIILLAGIPFGWFASDRILTASILSMGLMLVFFSRERIEDERVRQLKMKAMFTAMSSSFGVMMLTYFDYLDFMVKENARRGSGILTAPEFMAVMMAIAVASFHYWRWQDGRAT
jgi:hypothetical protein